MPISEYMKEDTAKRILSSIRLTRAYASYLKGIKLDSWEALTELSRSGNARSFLQVGGVIDSTYTVGEDVYDYPWIIMDFRDVELEDGSVYHDVPILQAQYVGHETVILQHPERTEATEEIAQDDWYYVGEKDGDYSVLSVKSGDSIPYSDYQQIYKTRVNSIEPVRSARNNWNQSFMRQYMNNIGTGWWKPMYENNSPPQDTYDENESYGFLSYLQPEMVQALHPIKIQTKLPSYLGGEMSVTYDKYWLASATELNLCAPSIPENEGMPFAYYKELLNSETPITPRTDDCFKRYNVVTKEIAVWSTRTINSTNEKYYYYMKNSGVLGSLTPNRYSRPLPCCALI